jgi:hypothetical protein
MADGKSRPIKEVKSGDRVADASPAVADGTTDQVHTVVGTHPTLTDRHYVDVTVATADGPRTIVGTAHHLYWDATSHSWAQASQLRVGHRLQTSGGATVLIVALHAYTSTMVTYNLSVENLHTYYVLAGDTPVLVHNCTTNQGVYIFDDISKPGQVYVGMSNDLNRRLKQHAALGRRNIDDPVICIHVCGDEDALRIREHIIKVQFQKMGIKLSSGIEGWGRNLFLNRLQRATQLELPFEE